MYKVKKIAIIIVVVLLLSFFTVYNKIPLTINTDVQKVLNIMGLEECYVLTIEDKDVLSIIIVSPQVDRTKKDEYIEELLNEQIYREVINDRKVVQIGDLAIANYKLFYEGKQLCDLKEEAIRVGSGYYDKTIEKAIVGLEIDEEYIIDVDIPEILDDSSENSSKYVLQILITDIYNVKIPTIDKYIIENGFTNINEFEKHVENELYESERDRLIDNAFEDILSILINASKFRLNEEIVVENALNYYYEYSNMAYIYNMGIEEYIEWVHGDEDDIYALCYERSEYEIKRYLIIGRLAFENKIVVTEQDILGFAEKNSIDISKLTSEEICYLKYHIIESEIREYIIDNFIELSGE